MKVLTIGGNDYKIEFTIEASLYNECTEKVFELFTQLFKGEEKSEKTEKTEETEKTESVEKSEATEKTEEMMKRNIKDVISAVSNIPQTVLTMFYAGLLEHHGEDGDGSVMNKKTAKRLLKRYFAEGEEDESRNFYDMMTMLFDCMNNDGFFTRIGAEKMLANKEQTTEAQQTTETKLIKK